MTFFKRLLVTTALVLGVISSPVSAQTYSANVNGTNYDFSTITGSFSDTPGLQATLQSQAWWGNSTLADTFASAVGGNLGTPNYGNGAYFAYAIYDAGGYNNISTSVFTGSSLYNCGTGDCPNASGDYSTVTYAVATIASAPEMNASFIPQVALMLACLFFLFGRKKENAEVMLSV